MVPDAPLISVVVPSHDRPLRLRWLLEALAEQTLPRRDFEVLVVHDSAGRETDELLSGHRLGVRAQRVGACGPARKRNAGWRAARAPLVAFTDDDCRPVPGWLEALMAAARDAPGAVVQGDVRIDPDELVVMHHAPWARSQEVRAPSPYGQTASIAYPRELLERTGGFDESLPVAAGEDTDLLVRATALGAAHVAAPGAVVDHAVFDLSLVQRLREARRWTYLADVLARHPHLRQHLVLGIFWKADHAWLLLAVVGIATRRPSLFAPYVLRRLRGYGRGPRAWLRAGTEMPGQAAIDVAELSGAVQGALRARTVFL